MDNKTILNIRQIMDILEDGNLGYDKLANQFAEYDVSTVFARLSQQRKMFIEELKYECLVQGERIMVTGTMSGFFHRLLMDLKEPFVDEENLIEMAVRGEQEAIRVYIDHMTADVPKFLRDKLEGQLNLIKGAIPQLQHFKNEVA